MSETEIIAAEISAHLHADSNDCVVLSPEAEAALDARLLELNSELERYTVRAGKAEYAFAIASGIVSGWMDSLFFGELTITEEDIGLSHKQVNEFIEKFADLRGLKGKDLKDTIGNLEDGFKVPNDNAWSGEEINVGAKNHHLADLAHHPTPVGLLASIAAQLFRVGIFVDKKGVWHFLHLDSSLKDSFELIISNVLIPAVITGVLNWLVSIGEEKYEAETGEEMPNAVLRLARMMASSPVILEVVACADNWFGHLVSDMGGSKNTPGAGMGIPGVFLSLAYELSALPGIKDSGLPEVLNDLYTKRKLDLRHELPFAKQLGKQAIPVLFNEIVVRLGCLLIHLGDELSQHDGFEGVNWRYVIPFANRTVDRMLTVSTMTFNMFDTADAAIRAAIESGGDFVVFSGKFVARYNFVGAGRATIAIVKEVSNENKERQLIHERMILMEAKSQLMFQQLQEFKALLDARLSDYLVEDIEAFMVGFDYMNEGLKNNDSDLVIHGNVVIQRVLGREVQFESQMEFDELMDSDEPLQL